MTSTRAESRRAYKDHQKDSLPKARSGTCARPDCERNYYSRSSNPYKVCPRCLEVTETIKWLLTSGVLQQGRTKTPLEELGMTDPTVKSS